MIAIDSNLLVYAHRAGAPQHEAAKAALEDAANDARGWGVAAPSLAELWMVTTHPSSPGGPSPGGLVVAFVEALRRAGMQIWSLDGAAGQRLLSLAAALGVAGARIFDLQIGICALEAGATEIWTHDRGFRAPPGLRVRDPLPS